MTVANRATTEWQRKAKEDERRKKQQKLRARERGEDMDSDDDNDEKDDEVVADIEWDDLETEDTLTGIHSSMQGPFLFHAGGSTSVRTVETGQTMARP